MTATRVLMGLRYPRTLVAQLFRGVHGMKDSVTYQEIVEEGARSRRPRSSCSAAAESIGTPSDLVENAVRSITDLGRLEELFDRILDVADWEDFLGTQ